MLCGEQGQVSPCEDRHLRGARADRCSRPGSGNVGAVRTVVKETSDLGRGRSARDASPATRCQLQARSRLSGPLRRRAKGLLNKSFVLTPSLRAGFLPPVCARQLQNLACIGAQSSAVVLAAGPELVHGQVRTTGVRQPRAPSPDSHESRARSRMRVDPTGARALRSHRDRAFENR